MAETIIKIENLSKVYNTKSADVLALENINLDINKGDIFGIIGLSGAGKSTLVRCINLLEKPTSGKVLFKGTDLCALKNKDILKVRRSIGMIFQGFNLLEQRTALKNVLFPLEISQVPKQKALERAHELLQLVGLSDRENSYPSQLSGGQKQRVAIARALATNPEVLLCDEATSALDPNTTKQILELLKSINEKLGVTIVVITHEMRVIEKICNKVAVIDHSNIVEYGLVKDVFLHPQSPIAKQLISPSENQIKTEIGSRKVRIVFDGESAKEPILAEMILSCRANANILYADTKEIDGKAFGQMLIQLPDDDETAEKMIDFLKSKNISYREEA